LLRWPHIVAHIECSLSSGVPV